MFSYRDPWKQVISVANLRTTRGDTYLIEMINEGWPNLIGATILYGQQKGGFEKFGSVVDDATFRIELTKEETGRFLGVYRYDVQATLPGDIVTTLAKGEIYYAPTDTDKPADDPLAPEWVG